MNTLKIADKTFKSRLFTGTGKFGDHQVMQEAILESGSELVTVAMKRFERANQEEQILNFLQEDHINILPNTSGVRTAKEAMFAAELAREAMETNWIKLEIHPDPKYLLPDPVETLLATEALAAKGFIILPYIHADPVLCKRLEEAGASAVMPLGSPIGSNKGLKTIDFLQIIIEQSRVPVIVDAGIGAPSDAARAMEIGADAVLVNTAIAVANDPVVMARAFRKAVEAGREVYEIAGAYHKPTQGMQAEASSPLTSFLDA